MNTRQIKKSVINKSMPEITTVDFTKQGLSEIPFAKIRMDVNWVILSDNKIKKISNEIKFLKNLSRLAMNDNRIEEIDPEIGECIGITWMDLTRNRLRSLPIQMGQLTRISGLGLSENEFDTIPECVYKLKNLRKFGFFSNKISFISPDIKNLKNLVKLDLSNNKLTEIPTEFCTLVNLSWLNLSNNKLKALPAEINNLKKLEELGLGMNQLEYLPDMSNLNSLRIFPVFKNRLKAIHPSLMGLKSIEKLDFSDNEIENFPFLALYNPSLKYLNLRNNKISEISSYDLIDYLSAITMIDISENHLKYIPFKLFKSFGPNTTIRLGSNLYEKLPSVISKGQSLLHICFTKILNEKNKIDPWLNRMFDKHHTCDYCKNSFVVEPCFSYNFSFLDSDHQFVVEKMLCSVRCLRRSEE